MKRKARRRPELAADGAQVHAIRCDHDGLKMAEIINGHLVLRDKHHGETHVKIIALTALAGMGKVKV